MSVQSRHALVLPLLVGGALLMENIDSTVISTSLPAMARDFGEDPIALKVGLTAYIVSLGVFIPISGWLADRFGARAVFRTAILVFSAGSLLCAMTDSLLAFMAARFIQGIGGALMVPVGRIVIFQTVPKADYVKAVSYLTVPSLLGPVLGPPLGGFITTYLNWRWIFIINLPIAALGLYLARRHMPDPGPAEASALDYRGFIMTALGASLLMLGPSLFDTPFASPAVAACVTALGVGLLLLYGAYAARTANPLLDLRLLRIPTFRASVLGGSLFRIALGAVPFLLPLELQEGLGMSAFESGTLTCCTAFGSLTMKSLARHTLRRFGFRTVLVYNALFAACMIASFGVFAPGTPHLVIAVVVLIAGVFPSLQFTSINAIAYADIPKADVARATSLASTVQQISLGMGITVAGITLQTVGHLAGHDTLAAGDFPPTFAVMALFSVASIIFNRRLASDAGAELAGRREVRPSGA